MNSTMKWIAGATLIFVGMTACGGSAPAPAPAPDEQDEATEDIQESAPAPIPGTGCAGSSGWNLASTPIDEPA